MIWTFPYQKTSTENMQGHDIIRQAFRRIGIGNDHGISRESGIPYDRLHKSRMRDTDNLTIRELKALQRHGIFSDEEVLELVKEGGNE